MNARVAHAILPLLAAAGLAGAPGTIRAQSLARTARIDFEMLPGADGALGTPDDLGASTGADLTDDYASLGVRFSLSDGSAPVIGNFSSWLPGSPHGLAPHRAGAFGNSDLQDMVLDFDEPVSRVRISSLDSDETWRLRAYDAGGLEIAVAGPISGGDVAVSPAEVSVDGSAGWIARVLVDITQSSGPDAGPEAFDLLEIDSAPCDFDAGDLLVTDDMPAGSGPSFAALSPDGTRLYTVVHPTSTTSAVAVSHTRSGALLATLPLGQGVAFQIAVTPDGSRAYVAISRSSGSTTTTGLDRVAVIRTSDNVLLPDIILTGSPIGLAISPDASVGGPIVTGYRVFVTARGATSLFAINSVTGTFTAITVPTQLIGAAVTPDGNRIYLANRTGDGVNVRLHVVNARTNTLVGAPIRLSLPRESSQAYLVVSADGRRAYVAAHGDGRLSVVDVDPSSPTYNTELRTLAIRPVAGLYNLALSPDGKLMHVTGGGRVHVLDVDPSSPMFEQVIGGIDIPGAYGVAVRGYPEPAAFVTSISSVHVVSRITPPTTDSALSGTPGLVGWHVSDVNAALVADDGPCGAGIRDITYSLAGAQSSGPTVDPGADADVLVSAEGVTTLTFHATDHLGNGEADRTRTIWIDKTPPVISVVTPDATSLWPPNHALVPVAVEVVATDALDPAPECRITSVDSDEATDDRGDGRSAPDWYVTGDFTLMLRAERSGLGDGRTYTVEVTCMDDAGLASTATTEVRVPKSMGRRLP